MLLDENLSESVAAQISADFPGTTHIRQVIGSGASDDAIWNYAKTHAMVLVTLDEDFQILSIGRGAPPKVIWIDAHNARNSQIGALLIERQELIRKFISDPEVAMLVFTLPRRS